MAALRVPRSTVIRVASLSAAPKPSCPKMSTVSETKHLIAGSDFPATRPGLLRLYSMKFCPYAQRTRLVLAHKGIVHEVVNVNLKSKPDWFLQRNPLGLVPVLELDGKVIYESAVCDEWLEDVYPEKKLGPYDPYAKAQWKMLSERFGKTISAFYKIILGKTADGRLQAVKDVHTSLRVVEEALVKPYFGGDAVGMPDFHFWPWIERLCLLRKHGFDLTSQELPRLHSWIDRMLLQPAVTATWLDDKLHEEFYKSFLTGVPNYDLETGPPSPESLSTTCKSKL